jgi:hypothetical protein
MGEDETQLLVGRTVLGEFAGAAFADVLEKSTLVAHSLG